MKMRAWRCLVGGEATPNPNIAIRMATWGSHTLTAKLRCIRGEGWDGVAWALA